MSDVTRQPDDHLLAHCLALGRWLDRDAALSRAELARHRVRAVVSARAYQLLALGLLRPGRA